MQKILITGHSGFVGSWLSLYLSSKKYKIYGVSLKNHHNNHIFYKANVNKICNNHIVDISNYNKLENVFKKVKPDYVIHLAAQPLVINSYLDPINTFKTNIIGTLNVLELANLYSSGKLINFTSDKVYKKNEKKSLKENDYLGGYDPYSLSKSCSDLIGQCLNVNKLKNNSRLKITTLRCGNLIGGGDWCENRIIPDYFRSYINKKTLIIRNPKSIRPWQHVINSINIIKQIMSLEHKNVYDTFNIGPNNSKISVNKILNKLNNFNNNLVKIKIKKLSSYQETKNLKLNNLKSKKIFKTKSKSINFDLKLTNDWYVNSFNKKNMYDFTLKQIEDYI